MKQASNTDKLTPKSLSCLNHLKHGSTSKTLFLKDEDPEEFFALLENLFLQYAPNFDHDAALVTRAAHDFWIMLRRERTVDAYEKALHTRKPDPTYWVQPDLHEMHLFDRYKTEAARAYTRSLKNLQTIQKMARDEQRSQQLFEREKQKLAMDLLRWQQMQRQNEAAEIAESFIEEKPVIVDEQGPHIPQDLYVSMQDGITHIFDTVPSNDEVHRIIAEANQLPTPPTHIVRTYIFAGLIPPTYQWLITEESQRTAKDQEIRKTLSFDEWRKLAAKE
jgi:hypothetical protein